MDPKGENHNNQSSLRNGNESNTGDRMQASLPNHDENGPSMMAPRLVTDPNPTDDAENRPPAPPLDVISASSNDPNNHLGGPVDPDPLSMEVDLTLEESNDIISQRLAPTSRFVPGPLREEPTLKEKLVDRERQRRKEAERARLKRQFALMSNGGGLVYDSAGGGGGASITGTVGEESTHADMEDSISGLMHSHNHHHQGGDTSPQLGYTMERFLQETATTNTAANNTNLVQQGGSAVAATTVAASSTSNAIGEEAIEADPQTAGASDKEYVMERFLNDPVVVDAAPPPTSASLREEAQISSRGADDVHRAVSFELRITQNSNANNDDRRPPINAHPNSDTTDAHLHNLSIDDSNASVRVEVAPEDDILEPVSPGGRLSVPSEVAPSSLDGRHHRQHSEMETSLGLGSVGPSIDRQSLSSNANNDNVDDDDTDDEPRVLRLTEAEIQEMAAIEEASIGNAPPSDRDAESLVGDLVGTFGTPNVGDAGTNFSQETPTTAMESGSLTSGHRMSARRSPGMRGDQPQSTNGENMDDIDRNSIDDMEMLASVSSHLVVSPGASVSGDAASVTANPPSEIIGRGETTTMSEVDDDRHRSPPPPSSVVVETSASEMPPLASPPVSVAAETEEDRNSEANLAAQTSQANECTGGVRSTATVLGESLSSAAIREELKTSSGPQAEEIANRRLRPGMVESGTPSSPQPAVAMRHPNNDNNESSLVTPQGHRTVDGFDFDKNDLPMTPGSLMSDSLRDLPGDDELWTSPGSRTKMTLHRSEDVANQYARRDPKLDSLAVPIIPPTSANAASSDDAKTVGLDSVLSQLVIAFNNVKTNNSSTWEEKQSERYSRGSVQSNAFEKRLLPILVTLIIEVPVLRMMSHDEKLCGLLGRQHYQLLLGLTPIIAAISGNISAQASALATTAICHGHVTLESYFNWIQKECKVAALLGLGIGVVVGALAGFFADGTVKENVALAVAVGIAQFISATSAGVVGSNSPILMCLLFKQEARSMGGLIERALVDLTSSFLTFTLSYCVLSVFLSPVSPGACMV